MKFFPSLFLKLWLIECESICDAMGWLCAYKPGARWSVASLKLLLSQKSVYMCPFACVSSTRLLITSGTMWHDVELIWLVK